MRFQKRIKILPGVSINLSKSGVSASVGPKGAKVTIGHGKERTTVGLPGTGISHTEVRNSGSLSIVLVVAALFIVVVILMV